MAIGKDIFELQETIGYRFRDITLLDSALTHSSYTNEQRTRGINLSSNERLEFLGDAILGAYISEYLYFNFTKFREGTLTKMRQQLVCEKALARIGGRIGLGDYLNLGNGEEQNGCRNRPKVVADALEALIAAVYLDAGEDVAAVRALILRLFRDEISLAASMPKTDFKTLLQQLTEQDGSAILEYRVVAEEGPAHDKSYTVVATVNGNEVGRGTAPTKKEAEMRAACEALRLFGISV